MVKEEGLKVAYSAEEGPFKEYMFGPFEEYMFGPFKGHITGGNECCFSLVESCGKMEDSIQRIKLNIRPIG